MASCKQQALSSVYTNVEYPLRTDRNWAPAITRSSSHQDFYASRILQFLQWQKVALTISVPCKVQRYQDTRKTWKIRSIHPQITEQRGRQSVSCPRCLLPLVSMRCRPTDPHSHSGRCCEPHKSVEVFLTKYHAKKGIAGVGV